MPYGRQAVESVPGLPDLREMAENVGKQVSRARRFTRAAADGSAIIQREPEEEIREALSPDERTMLDRLPPAQRAHLFREFRHGSITDNGLSYFRKRLAIVSSSSSGG
jgi:hypothetical protein